MAKLKLFSFIYVTVLRKNGLIAGLTKIDFFQKRHLLSSSTAYAKYEFFTKLCFHAMALNSRHFAIIAFLMFEENVFRVCCLLLIARWGLSISVYYSIARARANQRYRFCTKTLLSPSVSSSRYVFRTKNLK